MVDTYIVDTVGTQINSSSVSSQPSDRNFRGAWVIEGSVIQEQMTKAKHIFRNKVREARKPLLEAKDVELMKALETGASTTAIATAKDALRDAPADSAIASASDIAGLKAAWDTDVLGDSPYA